MIFPHLTRLGLLSALLAAQIDRFAREAFRVLALAYRESVEAARRREVAWALFVCRK